MEEINLNAGDKIDVTITGARVVQTSGDRVQIDTAGHLHMIRPRAAAVTVDRVTPEYTNNTLWTDRSGHLWLVQYEPVADDDNDDVHFYSSLGDCTREEADRYYGPFTRCVVQVQDAA